MEASHKSRRVVQSSGRTPDAASKLIKLEFYQELESCRNARETNVNDLVHLLQLAPTRLCSILNHDKPGENTSICNGDHFLTMPKIGRPFD